MLILGHILISIKWYRTPAIIWIHFDDLHSFYNMFNVGHTKEDIICNNLHKPVKSYVYYTRPNNEQGCKRLKEMGHLSIFTRVKYIQFDPVIKFTWGCLHKILAGRLHGAQESVNTLDLASPSVSWLDWSHSGGQIYVSTA